MCIKNVLISCFNASDLIELSRAANRGLIRSRVIAQLSQAPRVDARERDTKTNNSTVDTVDSPSGGQIYKRRMRLKGQLSNKNRGRIRIIRVSAHARSVNPIDHRRTKGKMSLFLFSFTRPIIRDRHSSLAAWRKRDERKEPVLSASRGDRAVDRRG